jgi:hypothetical protein
MITPAQKKHHLSGLIVASANKLVPILDMIESKVVSKTDSVLAALKDAGFNSPLAKHVFGAELLASPRFLQRAGEISAKIKKFGPKHTVRAHVNVVGGSLIRHLRPHRSIAVTIAKAAAATGALISAMEHGGNALRERITKFVKKLPAEVRDRYKKWGSVHSSVTVGRSQSYGGAGKTTSRRKVHPLKLVHDLIKGNGFVPPKAKSAAKKLALAVTAVGGAATAVKILSMIMSRKNHRDIIGENWELMPDSVDVLMEQIEDSIGPTSDSIGGNGLFSSIKDGAVAKLGKLFTKTNLKRLLVTAAAVAPLLVVANSARNDLKSSAWHMKQAGKMEPTQTQDGFVMVENNKPNHNRKFDLSKVLANSEEDVLARQATVDFADANRARFAEMRKNAKK